MGAEAVAQEEDDHFRVERKEVEHVLKDLHHLSTVSELWEEGRGNSVCASRLMVNLS